MHTSLDIVGQSTTLRQTEISQQLFIGTVNFSTGIRDFQRMNPTAFDDVFMFSMFIKWNISTFMK